MNSTNVVQYKNAKVRDLKVFYREAGSGNDSTLLLLHGFPTSSHMFRQLIPALADRYHVVAPDLPGFGFTETPDRTKFSYTFDHLADVISDFTETIGLDRFAIYVFDYGAPVGFRIALRDPERVTAIISQNGNAYVEGLSEGWNPIQRYWKTPSETNRRALRDFLKPDSVKSQYVHGVAKESLVAPESYTLDSALLTRPGNDEIQLDLFLDYASTVALYPRFQDYFRKNRPPTLAVWGKNDPFFLPAGAEAFKRDNPGAVNQIFRHRSFRFGNSSWRDRGRDPRLSFPQSSQAQIDPSLRAQRASDTLTRQRNRTTHLSTKEQQL
jgi:pimeloyl-ACP methyl ester carboxylesterase